MILAFNDGGILTRITSEVSVKEFLMITINGPSNGWPRVSDAKVSTDIITSYFFTLFHKKREKGRNMHISNIITESLAQN